MSHHGDQATRANIIHHRHAHHSHHAPHALKIRVLPSPEKNLITHEIGAVINHKTPIVHPAGVAEVQVHMNVRAVGTTLIGPTLEVLLLIESNLQQRKYIQTYK